MEQLREAGKIRAYGVGHLDRARVREYVEKGNLSSFMVELSPVARLGYRQLVPLVPGAGIVAFSSTGRGIMSGVFDEETRFAEGDFRRIDPLFQRDHYRSALRVNYSARQRQSSGLPRFS